MKKKTPKKIVISKIKLKYSSIFASKCIVKISLSRLNFKKNIKICGITKLYKKYIKL